MNKPNFFIVGKPKSGTTALHVMLNQHPEIFMSPFKEPNHFNREHVEEAERRDGGYRGLPYKDLNRYLELFEAADAQKIIGEASPTYLDSRTAASEIAKFNPEAKILMVLREPVSFIRSLHSQMLRSGNETESSLREALLLEEARKRGEEIPKFTSNPANLFYLERANYCEQVTRYLDVFDSSQVKVVIYEDFREDNRAVLKTILEFLGVDAEFSLKPVNVNVREGVRFTKLASWLIHHGERKVGAFKERAPNWLLTPVRAILRPVIFKKARHEPLDPQLRAELETKLRPDVERLGRVLGIDLIDKWDFGK